MCGYIKKTADDKKAEPGTETPKQDSKKSAYTGDTGNAWIWAIIIPAAAAGITAMVIYIKKRK